jgi:nicotinamide phosphoribosyltransferase
MTSATIAHQYRKVLTKWQEKTDKERAWFVDWQAHDFSMRGLDSIDVTVSSGLGHLTSFLGTDSLPALGGARRFYGETGFVGGSVNATEHSVMCAGTKDDEIGTFRRLLETYPTGILSVVSDTWDLWEVCTHHVRVLKDEILARDGKFVIRPDSGDPVEIICGTGKEYDTFYLETLKDGMILPKAGQALNTAVYYNKKGDTFKLVEVWNTENCKAVQVEVEPSRKGVIELLWDTFGGTINEQGYKVLDPHIGAIYGDSITLERAEEICRRLASKGFASTNIVFGVGSFTYQYNTRDTFGFAMKATYVEVNGEGREIFKDPITDDGTKKSATGLLHVTKHSENGYMLVDKVSWATEANGELTPLYANGNFIDVTTLTDIRNLLKMA